MSEYYIQVSSTVPEGKGVSSSAAVEVATMSAIAAAHGKLFVLFPILEFVHIQITC